MQRSFSLILAALPLLAGCVSITSVEKIDDPDNSPVHGFRYSLPATMLLVQPQADGTASYSWVYPSDPGATYAIRQKTFLAKFTQSYSTANGLLTKVGSKNDDSVVAAKVADAAQSVFVARETAKAADKKTSATAISAAQTAFAAAGLAHDQAVAEKKLVEASAAATPALILAADTKVSNAKLALDKAQLALTTLQSAANAPAAAGGPVSLEQYGPVLFLLSENSDGSPLLKAINVQVKMTTVAPAGGAAAAAPATGFTNAIQGPTRFAPGTTFSLTISVDPAAHYLDRTASTLNDSKGNPVKLTDGNIVTDVFTTDGKTVTIGFIGGLPAESYSLTPAFAKKAGETPGEGTPLSFKVGP